MNMYLRHVKLIQKALGCVVWVVSHSGKNRAAGMRGWSGQKAAFDVEIEVTTDEDKILRTATITKMKGGTAGAKFDFKLRSVPLGIDAEGDAYGSCVAEYVKHEYKPRAVKLSKVQSSALATIKRLSPDCDGVDWSDAVDAVSKARGFEKVKPYHRRDSMLTLHELKALGKVWIKGGEGAELLMGFGGSEPAEGWLNE